MAKRSIEPIRKYSTSDAYLIALLSEPVKRRNIKKLNPAKMKRSEELLQSIILDELLSITSIS